MESDCRGKEEDKGENRVSAGSVWITQVISEHIYYYSWSEWQRYRSSYNPNQKRRAAVQSVHTSVKVLAALVATQTYLLSQQDCLTFSPETNQLQKPINSSTSMLFALNLLWQTFPQIKHTYKQDPILDLGGLRARSHLVSTSSLMDPLFIGCCSDEAYLDWE